MLPGKSSLGSITGTHSGQVGDRLILQTVAAGVKGGNFLTLICCYTLYDLLPQTI